MRAIRWLNCLALFVGLSLTATLASELPGAAKDVHPLLIGASVPAVTIKTLDGEPYDLQERLDGKPSLLVFYRGGW